MSVVGGRGGADVTRSKALRMEMCFEQTHVPEKTKHYRRCDRLTEKSTWGDSAEHLG